MNSNGVFIPTQAVDGSVVATSEKLRARGKYVPRDKDVKVKNRNKLKGKDAQNLAIQSIGSDA